MSVRLKGTTNLQEINSNGFAQTVTTLTEEDAGYSTIAVDLDSGTITGARLTRSPEVDDDYRFITSGDTVIFADGFPSAAINTTIWNSPTTTMTVTVSAGFANLNAGLSVASAAVAQVRSYRHIPSYKQATTRMEWEAQFTQTPQTGNVCEMGMFLGATTVAPTDGVFFRLNAAGNFIAVVCNNSVETVSSTLSFATLVGTNTTHTFLIYSHTTTTSFWIDNVLVATIPNPAGQASNIASNNVPIAFRNYNSSATSLAQVLKIGAVSVVIEGPLINKPWGHILAGSGQNLTQGQTGQVTLGTLAIATNVAPAAAAAVVNISATAQFTGLGGIALVLPTLTAGTPGILFSYQVPAGTVAIPGKSLVITGVSVDSGITTVLTGGPLNYVVGLNYGSTNVSLATTESAIAKAPRRITIGMQNYVITAAAGIGANQIRGDYSQSPIYVHPGEFIQITLNNLGIVTTLGAVAFTCNFTGYWE